MSYRELRVREAHKVRARRHPYLTLMGVHRLAMAGLGVVTLGLGLWVMDHVDWASFSLWVIPGAATVGLLVWAFLWWTGRT